MDFDALFSSAGAAGWGCCAFDSLPLTEEARRKAEALCPSPSGVFVAAFPYGAEERPGNLSRYARGRDYHSVLLERLRPACTALERQYPGHVFVPGADNSPLPERECAWLAGLGLRGRNGLVILPPYGSWVFLGTILTSLPLSTPSEPASPCMSCGACAAVCPGGALQSASFSEKQCLSALTQAKGTLTLEQEALLAAHPLVWGCDLCQQVCPYNRTPELSALPEFRTDLVCSLSLSDVEGRTNRQFQASFPDRAFTWRGPKPLLRNLKWKQQE